MSCAAPQPQPLPLPQPKSEESGASGSGVGRAVWKQLVARTAIDGLGDCDESARAVEAAMRAVGFLHLQHKSAGPIQWRNEDDNDCVAARKESGRRSRLGARKSYPGYPGCAKSPKQPFQSLRITFSATASDDQQRQVVVETGLEGDFISGYLRGTPHLVEAIFMYLSPADLEKCRLVCSSWNEYISSLYVNPVTSRSIESRDLAMAWTEMDRKLRISQLQCDGHVNVKAVIYSHPIFVVFSETVPDISKGGSIQFQLEVWKEAECVCVKNSIIHSPNSETVEPLRFDDSSSSSYICLEDVIVYKCNPSNYVCLDKSNYLISLVNIHQDELSSLTNMCPLAPATEHGNGILKANIFADEDGDMSFFAFPDIRESMYQHIYFSMEEVSSQNIAFKLHQFGRLYVFQGMQEITSALTKYLAVFSCEAEGIDTFKLNEKASLLIGDDEDLLDTFDCYPNPDLALYGSESAVHIHKERYLMARLCIKDSNNNAYRLLLKCFDITKEKWIWEKCLATRKKYGQSDLPYPELHSMHSSGPLLFYVTYKALSNSGKAVTHLGHLTLNAWNSQSSQFLPTLRICDGPECFIEKGPNMWLDLCLGQVLLQLTSKETSVISFYICEGEGYSQLKIRKKIDFDYVRPKQSKKFFPQEKRCFKFLDSSRCRLFFMQSNSWMYNNIHVPMYCISLKLDNPGMPLLVDKTSRDIFTVTRLEMRSNGFKNKKAP